MTYTIKHAEIDYELMLDTMEEVEKELKSLFVEDTSYLDSTEVVGGYIVYEDGKFYAYDNDVIDYDELIKEWKEGER